MLAGTYRAAGSTRNSRRRGRARQARNACGTRPRPKRLRKKSSPAHGAARRREQAQDRRSARCCTTSPACSAGERPLRLSAKEHPRYRPGALRKHKVLTYPRTDSRHLPGTTSPPSGNPGAMSRHALRAVCRHHPEERLGASQQAHLQQCQGLRPLRHHSDGRRQKPDRARAEDHDLSPSASQIFFPAAEYNVTTASRASKAVMLSDRRQVLVTPGWLAVYGKEAQQEGSRAGPNLPPLGAQGTRLGQKDVEVKAKATQPPPPRFPKQRCSQPWKVPANWSRRRAARSHVRARPGYSSYSRGDHRGLLAEEYLHRNGQRTAADGQDLLAPVCARGAAGRRDPFARTHRRVGIQAEADERMAASRATSS